MAADTAVYYSTTINGSALNPYTIPRCIQNVSSWPFKLDNKGNSIVVIIDSEEFSTIDRG